MPAKIPTKTKIAMCIGCHGISGYQVNYPEVYAVPKIFNQSEIYIKNSLIAYQKEERSHPSMRGMMVNLNEQDAKEIASYFSQKTPATLPNTPKIAPSKEVAELLNKGTCTTCHGLNFAKPADPAYPKIAGQHKDYLFAALRAYKNDPNEKMWRSNANMLEITKQFQHHELKALADYIGSLEGDLQTVPIEKSR